MTLLFALCCLLVVVSAKNTPAVHPVVASQAADFTFGLLGEMGGTTSGALECANKIKPEQLADVDQFYHAMTQGVTFDKKVPQLKDAEKVMEAMEHLVQSFKQLGDALKDCENTDIGHHKRYLSDLDSRITNIASLFSYLFSLLNPVIDLIFNWFFFVCSQIYCLIFHQSFGPYCAVGTTSNTGIINYPFSVAEASEFMEALDDSTSAWLAGDALNTGINFGKMVDCWAKSVI